MSGPDNPEVRFTSALARLLKYFNLLEENIGLCIAHLVNSSNPKASYPLLARMTAEQKMDRLREIFVSGEVIADNVSILEFEEWFELAARARSIRNRYVHGHWEYLPMRSQKPVGVRAPAWMREKLGHEAEETMSLTDLEAVVDEMESVFDGFMRIRKKHGL